ncbi:MAG: orotidine-5'-phosphate decarboxylase [Candidatus Marinimicrobia bacterium]|nr:orotidine-5'-phosphate decarboxylase [Candidatus Neomarinimicrobiota bacterium]
MNYLEKLKLSSQKYNSLICMGLDPVMDYFPEEIKDSPEISIINFYEKIFEKMIERKVFPSAFKPNQGFFLQYDEPMNLEFNGSKALVELIVLCREYFPEIPIILDYKKGDIAKSSKNYAVEGFENWDCDSVTISPFMGSDSVIPFLEYTKENRGVYILNRTSNKGAKDFQNQKLENGEFLYQNVSKKIVEWSKTFSGTGSVVGATSMKELENIAGIFTNHNIPLLIPGVGSQGGSAKDVVKVLEKVNYDLGIVRINSSSGISFPWKNKERIPLNWADVCVDELDKLNEESNH